MGNKEKIFIGAKPFSNEQIKLTLPTYEILKNQIEEIRECVKENKNNINRKTQYNNTIGIFGERGTGKTSVAYTIIEELERKNQDIILPIIEPDTYGNSTTILGVILKFLKEQMEQLFKEFKKENNSEKFPDFFKNCCFIENNKLAQDYNEILEYFCYKDDSYRNLIINNYTDMQSYKEKYSFVLAPDESFAIKIKSFINQLIKFKKQLNENENEPLMIILIDDIDLKTNKCKELVEFILVYTCIPNVVCFILGDYEILKEALGLALLKEENLIFSGKDELNDLFSGNMNLVKRKADLANEYLKKIIPPVFRHNIIKWTSENISNFYFMDEKKALKYLLLDILGEDNIFYKNSISAGNEIIFDDSYEIFDNRARGIVNVYYSLYNYKNMMKSENKDSFVIKKYLIDTIINSSSFFIKYQKKIYNKFIIWGNNERSTKLNFEKLYKYKYLEERNRDNNFDINERIINEQKKEDRFFNRMFILLDLARALLAKSNENKEYICVKNIYIKKILGYNNYFLLSNDKYILQETYQSNLSEGDKAIFKELAYNLELQVALTFVDKIRYRNFNKNFWKDHILTYEDRIYLYETIANLILNLYGKEFLKNLYKNKKKFSRTLDFIENISFEKKNYLFLRFKLNYDFRGFNSSGEYRNSINIHKFLINYSNIIFNTILKENLKCCKESINYEKKDKRIEIIENLKHKTLTKEEKISLKEFLENEVDKIFRKVQIVEGEKRNNTKLFPKTNISILIDVDIKKFKLNLGKRKEIDSDYKILLEVIEDILNQCGSITLKDYSDIIAGLKYYLYKSSSYCKIKEVREALLWLEANSYIKLGDNEFEDLTSSDIKFIIKYMETVDLEKFNIGKLENLMDEMQNIINVAYFEIVKEKLFFNKQYRILTEDDYK